MLDWPLVIFLCMEAVVVVALAYDLFLATENYPTISEMMLHYPYVSVAVLMWLSLMPMFLAIHVYF